MRITGPSRRLCHGARAFACAILLASSALAAEETTLQALAKLAEGLSQNDSGQALSVFDSHTKEYGAIEANIGALTAQSEIVCAIDIVTEKEEGPVRILDVDWYMQLKTRSDGGPTERRRERVSLRMTMVRGHWKITSFSPLKILDPIEIR